MKTISLLLSVLLGSVTAQAATPPTTVLDTRIVKLTPDVAVEGQTITVETRRAPAPVTASPKGMLARAVQAEPLSNIQILFPTAKGGLVAGRNLARQGVDTYTVQVPAGALSGNLSLQIGPARSTSTVPFTRSGTGFSVVNFAQFNVVSLKLDGTECLDGQTIPATASSASEVYETRLATTAGKHVLEVVLGPKSNEPVVVWSLEVTATAGRITEVPLMAMTHGEYLASPGNPALTGSTLTAVWQSKASNGTLSGYDFAFNPETKATTWTRWSKTRSSVIAKGSVEEPAAWTPNAAVVPIRLLRANGTLAETLRVNFSLGTLTSSKGVVFRAK